MVDYIGTELKQALARELTEKLRSSTTVDWQVRDSLRILVRRLLQEYRYPPENRTKR